MSCPHCHESARFVEYRPKMVQSFAEAANVVLKKWTGPRVSESTVERTSEVVGHDIGQRVAAGEIFGAHALTLAQGVLAALRSLPADGREAVRKIP